MRYRRLLRLILFVALGAFLGWSSFKLKMREVPRRPARTEKAAVAQPRAAPRPLDPAVKAAPPAIPEETPAAGAAAEQTRVEVPSAVFAALLPLHRVKTPPGPYDWLATNPEPGQTFADYVASDPVRPDDRHRFIYIVTLGGLDPARQEIIDKTARMIAAYYTLPVKFLPAIDPAAFPASAQRDHPQTGDHQLLTSYIIEDVLIPARPDDAYALIAFTAEDLWPGGGWNYVFGQASLEDRVGVWSVYRNGDPNESPEAYQLCLTRTVKTGVHELGHMFGLHHCIYYECNMNGYNHLQEADRRPLYLCPVCLRKLQWLIGFDPGVRYENLLSMLETGRWPDDAARRVFQESLQLIDAVEGLHNPMN